MFGNLKTEKRYPHNLSLKIPFMPESPKLFDHIHVLFNTRQQP
jgi:hypothetical protein